MSNPILNGIMGLVVADALGVPVEFKDRAFLKTNPVTKMQGYGTYNQPAGTWSDDSSMTLALLDSLKNGLDYKDIMDKFLLWFDRGAYTPYGQVFDIGIGSSRAIRRYMGGTAPLESGGISEHDNGNGSLMRILPILFYLKPKYGDDFLKNDGAFDIIHNVSSLTHRHRRSQMACGIYISVASCLSLDTNLKSAIQLGIYQAMEYYKMKEEFKSELHHFNRIKDEKFKDLAEEQIKSSGYVIHTLEAAIWSLLNTNDYKSSVLKAVNLGNDTDTTAAVVGGLAGLWYGYDSIPSEWIDVIARRDYIEDLCNEYNI